MLSRFALVVIWLGLLSCASGCAINRATATVTPDTDLSRVKKYYEFSGLRGFSRRSGGMMGWAPFPAHDLPMASRKWLRKRSTYSWSGSSARALMKPRVSFPARYRSRSLPSVAAS